MRKIFKILLVLFLIIVGTGVIFFKEGRTQQNVLPPAQENVVKTIHVSLTVGEQRYEISVPEGSSVYDVLQTARTQLGITYRGKNFLGLGFFVDEINGQSSNPKEGKYWIYYVNGKEAQVGVSNYIVQPNDVITWKYEKSPY